MNAATLRHTPSLLSVASGDAALSPRKARLTSFNTAYTVRSLHFAHPYFAVVRLRTIIPLQNIVYAETLCKMPPLRSVISHNARLFPLLHDILRSATDIAQQRLSNIAPS